MLCPGLQHRVILLCGEGELREEWEGMEASRQEKALHLPPGTAVLRLQGLPDPRGRAGRAPCRIVAEPSSAQA